ncbi:hypothetical protein Syun_028152 [Stephania yunnanensis]|uniref:Uncharacterized protein n=1 Tax=Stephania yunnanensis TaxID=152371 RepID=A0AAP0HQV6_9MAGN
MCCGGTIGRLCCCLILLAVVIGLIFGFGVFEHVFDKLKHIFHDCEADARQDVKLDLESITKDVLNLSVSDDPRRTTDGRVVLHDKTSAQITVSNKNSASTSSQPTTPGKDKAKFPVIGNVDQLSESASSESTQNDPLASSSSLPHSDSESSSDHISIHRKTYVYHIYINY